MDPFDVRFTRREWFDIAKFLVLIAGIFGLLGWLAVKTGSFR